jgi:hypothetical protein
VSLAHSISSLLEEEMVNERVFEVDIKKKNDINII